MTIRESRTRLRAAEKAYNGAKPGRDLTEARQELTIARAEYQAACVDLIGRLENALEPFNAEVKRWHHKNHDGYEIYTGDGFSPEDRAEFNLGDLRRLSCIYKEIADAE